MGKKGFLILEDGSIYKGRSFGWEDGTSGEVVFNTGMVGYPEGFTDPSYKGQILVMTYPLIGNYGVPPHLTEKDVLVDRFESERIHIQGLIVTSCIKNLSHWESKEALSDWLIREKIPAIEGIDTRMLTQKLRKKGVARGIITFESRLPPGSTFEDVNLRNLVSEVSTPHSMTYGKGSVRILLVDCGVKLSIIRELVRRKCTVMRVPWNFDPFIDPSLQFDAIVVSNGPGDPKMVDKTIKMTKKALAAQIPIFGICLGNQILALAAGADTYKMKYGHRSQNQPVIDLKTGRCIITTQNHGYAVDTKTLPSGWEPWFENLNDGTNEGLCHKRLPFMTAQFHPEATPGPTDAGWIFDKFIDVVRAWERKHQD